MLIFLQQWKFPFKIRHALRKKSDIFITTYADWKKVLLVSFNNVLCNAEQAGNGPCRRPAQGSK